MSGFRFTPPVSLRSINGVFGRGWVSVEFSLIEETPLDDPLSDPLQDPLRDDASLTVGVFFSFSRFVRSHMDRAWEFLANLSIPVRGDPFEDLDSLLCAANSFSFLTLICRISSSRTLM